jgi:hypothetical protein
VFSYECIACFSLKLVYVCACSSIVPQLMIVGWAASSSGIASSHDMLILNVPSVTILRFSLIYRSVTAWNFKRGNVQSFSWRN